MIVFPNAKINLGLHVTGRRKDGYHDIETCFFPVPLYDALEIIPAKKSSFTVTGLTVPGNDQDNLILKAFQLLKKDFNDLPSIAVHLHKGIPMGAGLGGGSSDAAFALKLMNNLFDLHLEDWFLEEYALRLGSDSPFFIRNTPQIATGRGERLEPAALELKGKWLTLINPNLHIETQEAYGQVSPGKPQHDLVEVLSDPSVWKDRLVNDFEASLFKKYPQLEPIKRSMYDHGAFYAAMSGSGSTVFGLFDQEPKAGIAEEQYFVFKTKI